MEEINSRQISLNILLEVLYKDSYSNIALNKHLNRYKHLETVNKSFITQIVYGTIKYLYTIDYIINSFSKIKIKKMKPFIAVVLRMSVYQLNYLDKVPISAVCNEAVEMVKKSKYKGLSSFINGVLRNIARYKQNVKYPDKIEQPIKYLSVIYSFPECILKMWLKQYSFDFVEDICRATNEVPDISIRCNTLKISVEKLYNKLINNGINIKKGLYVDECLKIRKTSAVSNIYGFEEGYFQVQDESSMLVSYAAAPKDNQFVLDVCSAPGGKTTHMAELMHNSGRIIARDIYEHKLNLIKENCKRLDITNVETQLFNAEKIDSNLLNKADIVLIDAPCSGLGIIRKKPDIKLKKDIKDINDLIEIQRRILAVSSKYVRKGGTLIYSTCTINKKENIDNINWFVEKYPFELESLKNYLPDSIHCDTIDKGYIHLFPNTHKTDGFFIARLKWKE